MGEILGHLKSMANLCWLCKDQDFTCNLNKGEHLLALAKLVKLKHNFFPSV